MGFSAIPLHSLFHKKYAFEKIFVFSLWRQPLECTGWWVLVRRRLKLFCTTTTILTTKCDKIPDINLDKNFDNNFYNILLIWREWCVKEPFWQQFWHQSFSSLKEAETLLQNTTTNTNFTQFWHQSWQHSYSSLEAETLLHNTNTTTNVQSNRHCHWHLRHQQYQDAVRFFLQTDFPFG